MNHDIELKRTWAVYRYLDGEKPESICASLGYSKPWLYKWINRCLQGDPFWAESQSRQPLTSPTHTPPEIEEIVKLVRLNLYNRDLFCGAQAIRHFVIGADLRPLRVTGVYLTVHILTDLILGKSRLENCHFIDLPNELLSDCGWRVALVAGIISANSYPPAG